MPGMPQGICRHLADGKDQIADTVRVQATASALLVDKLPHRPQVAVIGQDFSPARRGEWRSTAAGTYAGP